MLSISFIFQRLIRPHDRPFPPWFVPLKGKQLDALPLSPLRLARIAQDKRSASRTGVAWPESPCSSRAGAGSTWSMKHSLDPFPPVRLFVHRVAPIAFMTICFLAAMNAASSFSFAISARKRFISRQLSIASRSFPWSRATGAASSSATWTP